MTKYIGIDVHSSTCTFCVMNAQGVELENRTIVTNGRLIIDFIKSLGKDLIVTFEECDLSCWLFDILQKHVRRIVVCNPAANARYKKKKTDKLDAKNMTDLLRGGFLKEVFHDGSQREKFRLLVSGYEDTIQETTRIKNRIKALERRTRSDLRSFKGGDPTFVLDQFTARLEQLEHAKVAYQEKLRASVKRFPETKYLVTHPGIKYIQAAKIIAQVVDPTRFRNKHKFFSYCDIVRHRRRSAERDYGSVRLYGSRTLKCVFKMVAHSVLKGNGCYRQLYDVLRAKGLSDKAARNAVTRKIAAVTLSIWRNKQPFKEQMIMNSLPAKDQTT